MTALVGAEAVARLSGEAFHCFHCSCCGRPGRADVESATVIVQRYRLGVLRVRFAHAWCPDSQVIEVDAVFDVAGAGAMLSKAAVLEYAAEPLVRPVLVLEPGLRCRSGPGARR